MDGTLETFPKDQFSTENIFLTFFSYFWIESYDEKNVLFAYGEEEKVGKIQGVNLSISWNIFLDDKKKRKNGKLKLGRGEKMAKNIEINVKRKSDNNRDNHISFIFIED